MNKPPPDKLSPAELAAKRAARLMDPLENNLFDAVVRTPDLGTATWLIEQEGVDPDCSTLHRNFNPLGEMILSSNQKIPHKLGFARLLVKNGASILKAKKYIGHISLLTLGTGDDYQDGDEQCAAYLLALFISSDITENDTNKEHFLIRASLQVSDFYDSASNVYNNTHRLLTMDAVIRNQNALVDYVTSSEDEAAVYLREQRNHPCASLWTEKLDIETILKKYPPDPAVFRDKNGRSFHILPANFSYAAFPPSKGPSAVAVALKEREDNSPHPQNSFSSIPFSARP